MTLPYFECVWGCVYHTCGKVRGQFSPTMWVQVGDLVCQVWWEPLSSDELSRWPLLF